MAQCEDPLNYHSNAPYEYLSGIFSSKKKAEKALKQSEKESKSYMVTYYVEKQEVL